MTEQHLWLPDELAAYLRIPVKTLGEWRHRGTGPAWVRMGKHVRYRPDAVAAWLAAQETNEQAA